MARLHDYLHHIAANSESYFQAHLAREDLARVERLESLAKEAADRDSLRRDALYLGWTPGDLRTGELKDQLVPLIDAMHCAVNEAGTEEREQVLLDAWQAFHKKRIEVLIHCL